MNKKLTFLTLVSGLVFVGCAPLGENQKSSEQVKIELANKKARSLLSAIYNQLASNQGILSPQKLLIALERIKRHPLVQPELKCVAAEYQFYIAWNNKNLKLTKRYAEDIENLCNTEFILQYPKLNQSLYVLKSEKLPLLCTFKPLSEKIKEECINWAKKTVIKVCGENPKPVCECFQTKNISKVASCYMQKELKPPLVSPVF